MYLGNFIKGVNKKFHQTYFSGISFDSKKIKKDNIFFAIKGIKFDGNDYSTGAISRGAKIIMCPVKMGNEDRGHGGRGMHNNSYSFPWMKN